MTLERDTSERAVEIARLADEQKAENVVVLDVTDSCNFTDCFVIATCGSTPHLRAVGRHIEEQLREQGERPVETEGYDTSSWIVQDFGDVVVHLQNAEVRDFYRLEQLWHDGRRIEWDRQKQSA